MARLRTNCGRLLRGLLVACGCLLAWPTIALAQSPSPSAEEGADVFGNMPGIVILLIPLLIGAALYLSYKLGRGDEETGPRREGAVSRTLSRTPDTGKEDS